jgi:hypothetical protein
LGGDLTEILNSNFAAGIVGVLGVVTGVLLDRLLRRSGKVIFEVSEARCSTALPGQEHLGPRTLRLCPAEASAEERDLVAQAAALGCRFDVQLYNDRDIRTGLRDLAVLFCDAEGNVLIEVDELYNWFSKDGAPGRDALVVINLPSRELVSLELEVSIKGEHKHRFFECSRVKFRGYFPDGEEYIKPLHPPPEETHRRWEFWR